MAKGIHVMKSLRPLTLALSFAACMAAPPVTGKEEDKKPNIIVILTDDMGFSDIGP